MSGEAEVLFTRQGGLGLVTLNRPKALNALTRAMCVEMKRMLAEWARDPAVKTVAITGAGERAFCAGGDIRALYESGKAGTPYALDFYRDEYLLNAAIKHYPKPYVAILNGITMGGGVGVSVHGSHRIATENTVFAMPETGIGLFPDVGGTYFLPRCPGEIGMYLALTGARLRAADMLFAGIGTHYVPVAKCPEIVAGLAAGGTPDEVLAPLAADPGSAPLAELQPQIDRIFAGRSVEAILSALDAEGSDWARSTAATIRGKSPTSLKLAYRQLREGRHLDFDESMRREYRMVHRIIAGHDFYEGVRAVVIDKDQAPEWKPAALDGVSEADIAAYFAPLPSGELPLG